MSEIRLSGVVELGDGYRVEFDEDCPHGAILIGGVDLVGAVTDREWRGTVIVGIQDERYIGGLHADCGWGYSEYTPMDPDTLKVGTHDLIEILGRYDEQIITVTISDEAIDMGAPAKEITA